MGGISVKHVLSILELSHVVPEKVLFDNWSLVRGGPPPLVWQKTTPFTTFFWHPSLNWCCNCCLCFQISICCNNLHLVHRHQGEGIGQRGGDEECLQGGKHIASYVLFLKER